MSTNAKLAAIASVVGIVSHTAYVDYSRRNHKPHPRDAIDPLILENVSTGDIVLFARHWYHEYQPLGTVISAFHYVHGTEYDHAGVVVLDKDGIPFLMEINQYQPGVHITNLEDRILTSTAHQIALIPIVPRVDYSMSERIRLFQQYNAYILSMRSERSESYKLPIGILSTLVRLAIGIPLQVQECPHARLILDSMRIHGVSITNAKGTSDTSIICSDFLSKENIVTSGDFAFDASTTMIRMR
jgi:hypothetical protein